MRHIKPRDGGDVHSEMKVFPALDSLNSLKHTLITDLQTPFNHDFRRIQALHEPGPQLARRQGLRFFGASK